MNEKTLIDFLALQNRWWYNKKDFPISKVYDFKRSDYKHLCEEHLEEKEATVIYGPRGVGKSTVLYEIIRHVLGLPESPAEIASASPSGIDGKRVLYATFEEPSIRKTRIIDLLASYAKYVLGEDISRLGGKIFIFFDEIQNADNWGDQMKVIQDLGYPIKFFISGSSSIALKNEASKGARRFDLYSMHPLKFSDFLRYHITDDGFKLAVSKAKASRPRLAESHLNNSAKSVYEMFLQLYAEFKPWQTRIELLFDDYLIKGGYPRFLKEKDYQKCAARMMADFLLGFHKDLITGKGVGDPKSMRDLVEYIASISSCETNYTSLMKKSDSAANTGIMKKYIYHLENAFLVYVSQRFPKGSHRKGNSFKIYLADIAIRNMLVGLMNDLLLKNPVQCGYATETMVFDHLLRLHYKFRPGTPLYYWKDERSGHEVDTVLNFNGQSIPVEIKKMDFPTLSDVPGIRTFCEGKSPGIVSCGKKLEKEENIIFVPHWLLAIIC